MTMRLGTSRHLRRFAFALACIPLLAPAAFAQAAASSSTAPVDSVLFSAERSSLDKGLAAWTEYDAHWLRQWQGHRALDIGFARTQRFGLDDNQASITYATPLTGQLAGTVEASVSDTHRVLPKYAVGGELQYEFAPSWLVHGGLRHTRYDNSQVNAGKLQLEHYFGNFSASAAWSPVRASGTSASGYELRGAYYYADNSSVGFIAGRGDEATIVTPGVVTLAAVRSFALLGKHAFTQRVALTWSLHHVRQGGFYTREGASLGVQVAF